MLQKSFGLPEGGHDGDDDDDGGDGGDGVGDGADGGDSGDGDDDNDGGVGENLPISEFPTCERDRRRGLRYGEMPSAWLSKKI